MVQREINKKTAHNQARSFMARTLEDNGKACQAVGEATVVEWKAPSGECTKIARDLFHWPGGQAGKEDNSQQHYNLVHKIYSHVSSHENSRSRGSSGQGLGKNGENFGVETDESQKQERGDRWSKDEGRKSSFRLTDGHMSFEKCWIGDKLKIQRSSSTPRWYCKRRFWVLRSIHWTRFISITNDSSKSHVYYLQIAWLRGTSNWRSICLYPGKNGGCSQKIL